uniref:Uncharacterized protein n=1 Tax=Cebus imitator TaxID=2715852 RepID=A0A2K5PEC6_CEBIM
MRSLHTTPLTIQRSLTHSFLPALSLFRSMLILLCCLKDGGKGTSVSNSEISSRKVKLFLCICYTYEDLTIQCCLGTSLRNILRLKHSMFSEILL